MRIEPPISVWENGSTKRTISDVEGAAQFLLNRWPTDDDPFRRIASEEALRLMERGGDTWPFRALFEHACFAAGILAPLKDSPQKSSPGHVARPWSRKRRA